MTAYCSELLCRASSSLSPFCSPKCLNKCNMCNKCTCVTLICFETNSFKKLLPPNTNALRCSTGTCLNKEELTVQFHPDSWPAECTCVLPAAGHQSVPCSAARDGERSHTGGEDPSHSGACPRKGRRIGLVCIQVCECMYVFTIIHMYA